MKRIVLFLLMMLMAIPSISFASRVHKEYFPDGKIYYIQVYDDHDKIIGPYRRFYPNGRLREKIWYKNGFQYRTKRWDINGKPISDLSRSDSTI